jgi:tetratricopeptide (TPR) repeat protein
MSRIILALALSCAAGAAINLQGLKQARDRQDRAGIERLIAEASGVAAKQQQNAAAHYELALAHSYLAEVAAEQRDKAKSADAAEAGIKAAERAVALEPKRSENHRVLGTLCGQVIPGNLLLGLRYGRCALDSMNKAIELDPKSPTAYLGRAVGYYYLPAQFGGGVEPALKDLNKAIQLDPKSADAYLWRGIVLRKANRNAEAREALAKSVALNPARVWAKQQLEKTPAK